MGRRPVLVLLGLYVGAYYAMVRPTMSRFETGGRLEATYAPGNELGSPWAPFFAPIHRLDRLMRPHVWELQ